MARVASTKKLVEFGTPLGKNTATGVIHIIKCGASNCGASKRNVLISLEEAEMASESRYCSKCFISKPDLVERR